MAKHLRPRKGKLDLVIAEMTSNLLVIGGDDHHEKLVNGLWNYFLDNHPTDFEFQWNGRVVRTHRLLLDVFLSTDKLLGAAAAQQCIEQQQSDSSVDSLLEFMYKGTVSIPKDQFDSLFEIAKESDFKILLEALETKSAKKKREESRNLSTITTRAGKRRNDQRKDQKSKGYQHVYGNVKGIYSDDSDASNDEDKDPSYNPGNNDDDEAQNKRLQSGRNTRSSRQDDSKTTSTTTDIPITPTEEEEEKPKEKLPMFVCKHCKYRTLTGDLMLIHLYLCHKIGPQPGTRQNVPTRGRRRAPGGPRNAKPRVAKVKPPRTLQRCDKCPYTSYNPLHFKVHCDKHDPANIVRYQCPICPYSNKSKSQLGYHVKGMHSAVKPYRCAQPGCTYSCRMKTNLRIHVEIAHLDRKPFVCDKCAYRTYSQHRLNNHLMVHSEERPFKCTVCDKSYRRRSTLNLHNKTHTGQDEQNHVCDLCGSAFRRRDTLVTHLRSVHKAQVPTGANRSAPPPVRRPSQTAVQQGGVVAPNVVPNVVPNVAPHCHNNNNPAVAAAAVAVAQQFQQPMPMQMPTGVGVDLGFPRHKTMNQMEVPYPPAARNYFWN